MSLTERERAARARNGIHVGSAIHGFASGYFGRDSYDCRVVEDEGRDWLVTRNTQGVAEFISRADAEAIHDPGDLSFCDGACNAPRSHGDESERERQQPWHPASRGWVG